MEVCDLEMDELGKSRVSNEEMVQMRTDNALDFTPIRQQPAAILFAQKDLPEDSNHSTTTKSHNAIHQ